LKTRDVRRHGAWQTNNFYSIYRKGGTVLKEEFENVQVEIIVFDAEDVITASGDVTPILQ